MSTFIAAAKFCRMYCLNGSRRHGNERSWLLILDLILTLNSLGRTFITLANSIYPDKPAHPGRLIRIYTVIPIALFLLIIINNLIKKTRQLLTSSLFDLMIAHVYMLFSKCEKSDFHYSMDSTQSRLISTIY